MVYFIYEKFIQNVAVLSKAKYQFVISFNASKRLTIL